MVDPIAQAYLATRHFIETQSGAIGQSQQYGASTKQVVFNAIIQSQGYEGSHVPAFVSCHSYHDHSSRGLITDSNASTHMALSEGHNFFICTTDKNDPLGKICYTSRGDFAPDENGDFCIDVGGEKIYLLGYKPDDKGKIVASGALTDLQVINVDLSEESFKETRAVDLSVKLSSTAAAGDTHIATATSVVDAQATSHTVRFKYTRLADENRWKVCALTDDCHVVKRPKLTQAEGYGLISRAMWPLLHGLQVDGGGGVMRDMNVAEKTAVINATTPAILGVAKSKTEIQDDIKAALLAQNMSAGDATDAVARLIDPAIESVSTFVIDFDAAGQVTRYGFSGTVNLDAENATRGVVQPILDAYNGGALAVAVKDAARDTVVEALKLELCADEIKAMVVEQLTNGDPVANGGLGPDALANAADAEAVADSIIRAATKEYRKHATVQPEFSLNWHNNGAHTSLVSLDHTNTAISGDRSETRSVSNNGAVSALLRGLYVSPEGEVFSKFAGSHKKLSGMVPVAKFDNDRQLEESSYNTFKAVDGHGELYIKTAGSEGVAQILSGKVAKNPVDVMVKMTEIMDKNLQANSQLQAWTQKHQAADKFFNKL